METTFIFDVNETLLDSGSLDPLFESAFGDASLRKRWFAELLQRAWACTIAGEYRPFPELAGIALDGVGRTNEPPDAKARGAILERFAAMPAHPDAAPALAHLEARGAQLFALTNSPRAQAEDALERAGLRRYFKEVLSVEAVRAFKPDPRVYEMAVRAAHDVPSKTWLFSSHWWDCLGAARQGWKTALIAREAQSAEPALVHPTQEAATMLEIVQRLAATGSPVP